MKDKTRRYETGKMFIDLAKYFATAIGAGSIASGKFDWRVVITGLVMTILSWSIGFVTIPEDDKETK